MRTGHELNFSMELKHSVMSGAAAVLEVGSGGQIFGSCWVMRITSAPHRTGVEKDYGLKSRLWVEIP